MADNIVLIGFMGSGKTSMGIRMSYKLRRSLIDTDKMIEKSQGKSITDIFAQEGEPYFRELETKTLEYLVDTAKWQIISVGGGTPLKEENRNLMHQLGKVIYLRVTAETVCERLKGDTTRPLLQGNHPEQKVEELLSKREALYRQAADYIIECDGKDATDVLMELMEVCK